ncbi:uncharacterized protein (TIGR02246 family) [Murinocardiopsis flavida]|uniref:Uncharacterized protein (TIGR02246 family) n=1 Tax=Murinocardiopsis flavida TaxID=645275 RepID=A0A2P8DR15_9ACTN|nr:SgcJ/EcaC family oxidoreductase [Murinocardiopsis flavida]PSK99662.1 uncharacterized protein (TIGR02246 family) [Murinocardiopsis flavida]
MYADNTAATATESARAAAADLVDRLYAAWNAGDADSYGALFTEDATYIVFNGMQQNGRTEITEAHRWLFDGPLKGTRIGRGSTPAEEPAIRVLTPDVAHIVHAGGMAMAAGDEPDPGHDSRVSLVAVRTESGWRLAAFQNTRRAPFPGEGGPR